MSRNVNFASFSAEQIRFMLALADPDDHRTQKELSEELGVRPETLSRWKREPNFGEAVWELTYRNLESEIGRISSTLLKLAREGDIRSLRLFYEVLGKIGAQKTSMICTREHFVDDEDMADCVKGMTQRQLVALVEWIDNSLAIGFPKVKNTFDEVCIEEDVQLAVV